MNWLVGTRFNKKHSLIVLPSFVILIAISGSLKSVFAAEDPSAAMAKAAQGSIEIPGSFKDFADSGNAITAKRSAERIEAIAPNSTNSLEIDAEKAARPLQKNSRSVESDSRPTLMLAPAISNADLADFDATAYCLKGITASGVQVRPGMIAADPSVLPLGTVVHLRAGRYTGTYTVTDTGGRIKGRRVDVYVVSRREAVEFGRRQVKLKVIGSTKGDKANKNLLASDM